MKLPEKLAALAEKIHPVHDRVLVKRFDYQHPVLAVVGIVLQKGVVVAVGPGKPRRRKLPFKHGTDSGRTLWFEDGDETGGRHPMVVKPGDVVEFSPRGQVETEIDGELFVMIRLGSIYGITNDSKHEAMLWQQSAGYDRHGNFLSGKENWERAAQT